MSDSGTHVLEIDIWGGSSFDLRFCKSAQCALCFFGDDSDQKFDNCFCCLRSVWSVTFASDRMFLEGFVY